jgi:mannitol 2-dehydrogenase
MSCDNIPENGDLARSVFSAYARARDPELGDWVRDRVAFPNAMVDRITPVTADADREALAAQFGLADRWPVVSESFAQWVLEDDFPLGRPAWDQAGVQLVDDVEPYELMKLRLLNAGHQALCYAGWLAGHRYAHEVLEDPVIRTFLRDYMVTEGKPSLPPVPGEDLDAYIAELLHRFANPQVRDTVARLCLEGSDRIPKFLIPVIRENLAAGRPILRSVTVVASFARYMEAVDEQGEPIPIVDRLRDRLTALAADNRTDPLKFVRDGGLFPDLAENPVFVKAYTEALDSFHENGAIATLTRVNDTLTSHPS